jgi:predicted dehydrogenase
VPAPADRSPRQPRQIPLNDPAAAPSSDASPVRVGVIGLGFGADVHIPALKHLPETDVVAVCSRRPEHAHLIAAQHLVPHVTIDYRNLINHPEVDAVIVATPPNLHHQIAIAAIEAGKPILLESPMARSHAEARDLVRMAERAGVVAMVNHEYRYILVRRRAKELIDEGFIGTPYSASMMVYKSALNEANGRKFSWLMEKSKAGGMLGYAGSHHIDAMRWWFGDVKAVTGGTATLVKQRRLADSHGIATADADDNFALIMQFMSGAMATIHYSATAAFNWGEQVTLTGSEGTLIIQNDDRLFGARLNDGTLIEMPIPTRLFDDLPPFDHYLTAPTARVIQQWVKAIRARNVSTLTFEDGSKVQEVMDAVTRAGAKGRWVDVSGQRWPTAPTRME